MEGAALLVVVHIQGVVFVMMPDAEGPERKLHGMLEALIGAPRTSLKEHVKTESWNSFVQLVHTLPTFPCCKATERQLVFLSLNIRPLRSRCLGAYFGHQTCQVLPADVWA